MKNALLGFSVFVLSASAASAAGTMLDQLKGQAGHDVEGSVQVKSVPGTQPKNAVKSFNGGNPYEVLKALYESADATASSSDFGLWGSKENRQECWYTNGESDTLRSLRILRVAGTVIGKPSRGPLFPGTPDEKLEKVVLVWESEEDHSRAGEYFDGYQKNRQEGIDFIVRADESSSSYAVTTRIRKNKDLVAFRTHMERHSTEKRPKLYYGYCYQK